MTAPISAEFLALQELLAGRYSIERELGRGGMGIVLLARDVALDRPLATKLLQEVAWALGAAHQRGVIHRDVKPDNIMIERATERAVVTDFGIALGSRAGKTESPGGAVTGTARYMSPEQACGEPVDGRSDLYSLGATFFYALTGRAPFEAANLPAIMTKHVYEPAPQVQALRPEVPAKLSAVVDRLLRKAPPRRFQTADDLARVAGELRGRDFRAPPLLRAFVRNAQVSTLVLLASVLAGKGMGIIGAILLFQLVVVARRLLKDGYTFGDIRAALLAERQVQLEEDEVIKRRRWFLRLDALWYRVWAGRAGRAFFWPWSNDWRPGPKRCGHGATRASRSPKPWPRSNTCAWPS